MEINDAGFFPGALLDARHLLQADEVAIAVARQQRGVAFFQCLRAVEVFFDGGGVAFHRSKADAEFTISRK